MDNPYEMRHGITARVDDGFPSLSRLHTLPPARPKFHRAQPSFQGPPLIQRLARSQNNECQNGGDDRQENNQREVTSSFHSWFALANSFSNFTTSSTIRSP